MELRPRRFSGPGNSYEFTFQAKPGDMLSFATMLVQTNDLFYAPNGAGIDLFDNSDMPMVGNITSQIMLWDAGTEENQKPGVGLDQAPRQTGANTGLMDTNNKVRMVSDGFMYPSISDVIRITISEQ